MDKKTLKKYKRNKGRLSRIDARIDYLCNKEIEVVTGKVYGSSQSFPYTKVGTSVQMYQPEENDSVNKEIREKEAERILVIGELKEVEEYISDIKDVEVKELFELHYLEGYTQEKVSEIVNIDRSYVSKKINNYLKLSQNSQL